MKFKCMHCGHMASENGLRKAIHNAIIDAEDHQQEIERELQSVYPYIQCSCGGLFVNKVQKEQFDASVQQKQERLRSLAAQPRNNARPTHETLKQSWTRR